MSASAESDPRLAAISRCSLELENMRTNFRLYPEEKVSVQVGECDWLEELHRLLYEGG